LNLLTRFICCRKVWTLDICTILLPHIQSLLRSKHDSYCRTAISTLLLILRGFSLMFIDYSKLQCPPGTNLTTEERAEKCRKCCSCLMRIRDDVTEITKLRNADISGSSSEMTTLCAMLGSLVDSIASHPQDS
ncbi:hypothetical protein D918_02158, partial [Trichuris suis]